MFQPARREQLHADANAEERRCAASTRSAIASTMPVTARSPLAQAPKLPTPGRTIRSAARTTSGSAVTVTPRAPAAFSALWTE